MTAEERKTTVAAWRSASEAALASAKALYDVGDYRGATNRAYYAAYQAATSEAIRHGDEATFPEEWENPTHQQLPDLIANNGDLPAQARQEVLHSLKILRKHRETSDYKPGRTMPKDTTFGSWLRASTVLALLEKG